MTIETKYNIGDEVWAMSEERRIYVGKIEKTRIYIEQDDVLIDHLVCMRQGLNCWIANFRLFPTKEELLNSL